MKTLEKIFSNLLGTSWGLIYPIFVNTSVLRLAIASSFIGLTFNSLYLGLAIYCLVSWFITDIMNPFLGARH